MCAHTCCKCVIERKKESWKQENKEMRVNECIAEVEKRGIFITVV